MRRIIAIAGPLVLLVSRGPTSMPMRPETAALRRFWSSGGDGGVVPALVLVEVGRGGADVLRVVGIVVGGGFAGGFVFGH
jgi:hypothetical protein